jgi:hypothetical protein
MESRALRLGLRNCAAASDARTKTTVRTLSQVASLAAALLSGACFCAVVDPQKPTYSDAAQPLAEQSAVIFPISTSLEVLRQLGDMSVPNAFGEDKYNAGDCDEQGHCGADPPACKWNAGYHVDRSPLSLTGAGQTVKLSAQLSYWLEARVRPVCPGPLITVGCGDENNPNDRRHVNASMAVAITLKDDWDTNVAAFPAVVSPVDDCKVGPFGVVNLTDKITALVRSKLDGVGGTFDQKLREGLQLKARMTSGWKELGQPIQLGDSAWLVLNLDAIQSTQPTISAGVVSLRAALLAHPVVMLGNKPSTVPPPLPPRTDPSVGNAFVIDIPAEVSYSTVRDELRRRLAMPQGTERMPPPGSAYIQPTDVEVQGYGPQVAVSISFRGKIPGWWIFERQISGTVYLTGTPTYNEPNSTISFPDLDFTAQSSNKLVKIVDFMKHKDWRDQLRGQLVIDIKKPVQEARNALLKALNRQTASLKMSGTIDQFEFLGLWSDPKSQNLRAYSRAVGTVAVDLTSIGAAH